jgi:hypothetical protein
MRIQVRWLDKWADLILMTDNVVINLGMHDLIERQQLADHLREVINELEADQ